MKGIIKMAFGFFICGAMTLAGADAYQWARANIHITHHRKTPDDWFVIK